MLPEAAIERFTLAEGRSCPAVSLYLELDPDHLTVIGEETRVERVSVAANLRHAELDAEFTVAKLESGGGNYRYKDELTTLWRLATLLEAGAARAPARRAALITTSKSSTIALRSANANAARLWTKWFRN
jgi:exoribonuclease II